MKYQTNNRSLMMSIVESKLTYDFRLRLAQSVREGADEEFGRLLKRLSKDDIEYFYKIQEIDSMPAVGLLGLCCYYGRYEQVKRLFEFSHNNKIIIDIHSGAVNNRNEHKALYKAVEGGDLRIVSLLEAEAKLQDKAFSSNDYTEIVSVGSITATVDILEWILARTQISDSSLYWNFRLAAVNGNIQAVQFYAGKAFEHVLSKMSHDSWDSIFIDTACNGHVEVLNLLIKSRQIDNDLDSEKMIHCQGDLAFVRAVGKNQIQIVERLLELTRDPLKRHQMIHASEPVFGTRDAAFKQCTQHGYYRMLKLLINEVDDPNEQKQIATESFPYGTSTQNSEILNYLIGLIHDEELQVRVIGEAFVKQTINPDSSKIQAQLDLILSLIPSKRQFIIETYIDQAFLRASQISQAQDECTEAQEFLLQLVPHLKRLQLTALIEGRPKRWTLKHIETLEIRRRSFSQVNSRPSTAMSTTDQLNPPNLVTETSKSLFAMSQPLPTSSTLLPAVPLEILDRYRAKKDVSAHLSIVDAPPDVKIDLLILTVKEPELLAVFELLEPLPNQSHIIGYLFEHSMYYFGRYGRYNAALLASHTAGLEPALHSLGDAIRQWQPQLVINVGIAWGADPSMQKLGDVLIADKVVNVDDVRHEKSQIVESGPMPEIDARSRTIVHTCKMLWSFNNLEDQKSGVHLGLYLGSNTLLNNPDAKREFLQRHPRAVGGEMESYAVYAAAARSKIPWMVIKGISDWGDGTKPPNKAYHGLATASAASFVHKICTAFPNLVQRRAAESDGKKLAKSSELAANADPNRGCFMVTRHDLACYSRPSSEIVWNKDNILKGEKYRIIRIGESVYINEEDQDWLIPVGIEEYRIIKKTIVGGVLYDIDDIFQCRTEQKGYYLTIRIIGTYDKVQNAEEILIPKENAVPAGGYWVKVTLSSDRFTGYIHSSAIPPSIRSNYSALTLDGNSNSKKTRRQKLQ